MNSKKAELTKELKKIDLSEQIEGKKYLINKSGFNDVSYGYGIYKDEEIPGLIDFIKIEAQEIWKSIPEFIDTSNIKYPKIVISDEYETETFSFDANHLKSQIRSMVFLSDDEDEKIIEKIRKHLSVNPFTDVVKGRYEYISNEIQINYRLLDANDIDSYIFELRFLLGHLIFNHIHYMLTPNEYRKEEGYEREARESLADFFSYQRLYLEKDSIWYSYYEKSFLKTDGVFNIWKQRQGANWPNRYAYKLAKGLDYFENRDSSKEEFKRLFEISLNDMNKVVLELRKVR